MPFDGMIPADAYLWAKYRDDLALLAAWRNHPGPIRSRRGYYGTVGDDCVIRTR